VELRQRLAERDARIASLKQELGDKGRQADALQVSWGGCWGEGGGLAGVEWGGVNWLCEVEAAGAVW
jgi:hypothetical protein